MRDDRPDAAPADPAAERLALGEVERPAAPLIRVLGEDLQRLAAVRDRALDRFRRPAGHRHVRSDAKHPVSFSIVAFGTRIGLAGGAARAGVVAVAALVQPAETVDVQILAINDFHGALEAASGGTVQIGGVEAGGMEYLAAHLARLEAANPNTVFVSAGDNIGATPLLSSLFHDEITVEALDLAGLQVSALGNHDLDEGWWELYRMQRGGCHPLDGCQDGTPYGGAAFAYLAANLTP